MHLTDRFCMISYDEMQINNIAEYIKSLCKTIGYITLDPVTQDENWVWCNADLGKKIFAVLSKGMISNWKQVIACHVTQNEYGEKAVENTKKQCVPCCEILFMSASKLLKIVDFS